MAEVSILEYSQDVSTQEAPPPLPVGEYPATIESVEQKTSATSGNEYLSVTFRVSADDYPADFNPDGFEEGLQMQYNRLLVEDNANARYRMRKFCEAIGAKMGKRIDPAEWTGMNAKVGITHQPYEGEQRAQISKVLAA